MTREQAIDQLVENDINKMDDHSISCVLREGCVGYDSMSNEEIEEAWERVFDEEITIEKESD